MHGHAGSLLFRTAKVSLPLPAAAAIEKLSQQAKCRCLAPLLISLLWSEVAQTEEIMQADRKTRSP